jgi:uncharacterized protein (TIGR03437 family)
MSGRFSLSISLLALSLTAMPSLWAQNANGLALAGYGYDVPKSVVVAAPGQVIVVSVYGIHTVIPIPLGDNSLPKQIGGMSVTLTQPHGPSPLPVSLFGIQQTACPPQTACAPVTSISLLMPFELIPETPALGAVPPLLTIQENGTTTGQIQVLPVPDSVHMLNSCDQTLIYMSAASELPRGTCAPMVLHAHGPLVTAQHPAAPGEILVMFAYGLGATEPLPSSAHCCLLLTVEKFDLNFDFRPNAPPTRNVAGTGIGGIPLFTGLIFGGVYQINFAVPLFPDGKAPPPCGTDRVTSNLTVTLSASSVDAAQLCIAPN